jgi:hypothetical protein
MSYGCQEKTLKSKLIALSIAIVVFFGGFFVWQTVANSQSKNCVTVVVDYGILKNGQVEKQCIAVLSTTSALSVLDKAGYAITGTEKYGDRIACRVNDLPSAISPIKVKSHKGYLETCKDMPAEFAYWAVLVKMGTNVPNPLDVSAKWNWAQTGINEVTLKPGDFIALVFADNENVRFPQ